MARGGSTPPHTATELVIVRLVRVGVLALGLAVPLMHEVLEELARTNRIVASSVMWILWGALLLSVLVPASSTLTVLRLVAPAHAATLVLIVSAGGIDSRSAIALAISVIVAFLGASAETGAYFIQCSAYGDERRFPLRCPRPFVAVVVLAWSLWFACAAAGVVLAVAGAPIGWMLVIIALAGFAVLPRRFHRYARRWLVRVPAGLVIHDHLVLAETVMFPRRIVTMVGPWTGIESPGDEPFDLSGGFTSSGLVIHLTDPETVILAPTKEHPGGHAFHVRSARVRPTRTGRALRLLQASK